MFLGVARSCRSTESSQVHTIDTYSPVPSLTIAMYITQKWVLKRPFEGVPKEEDFELVEETLPDLQEGGELPLWLMFLKLKHCIFRNSCNCYHVYTYYIPVTFLYIVTICGSLPGSQNKKETHPLFYMIYI